MNKEQEKSLFLGLVNIAVQSHVTQPLDCLAKVTRFCPARWPRCFAHQHSRELSVDYCLKVSWKSLGRTEPWYRLCLVSSRIWCTVADTSTDNAVCCQMFILSHERHCATSFRMSRSNKHICVWVWVYMCMCVCVCVQTAFIRLLIPTYISPPEDQTRPSCMLFTQQRSKRRMCCRLTEVIAPWFRPCMI